MFALKSTAKLPFFSHSAKFPAHFFRFFAGKSFSTEFSHFVFECGGNFFALCHCTMLLSCILGKKVEEKRGKESKDFGVNS